MNLPIAGTTPTWQAGGGGGSSSSLNNGVMGAPNWQQGKDGIMNSPIWQSGTSTPSPFTGVPPIPQGSKSRSTRRSNYIMTSVATLLPFKHIHHVDTYDKMPCFTWADEHEVLDKSIKSYLNLIYQRKSTGHVHIGSKDGWQQHSNAHIILTPPAINLFLALYQNSYANNPKNKQKNMYPTAMELSKIIRPYGVCNTQDSTAALDYGITNPVVKVFVIMGMVDVHNIWGCLNLRNSLPKRITPGTQIFFGLKMRRVIEEGQEGPVTLTFKLSSDGEQINVPYNFEYLWEIVPFVLPPNDFPNLMGKWPIIPEEGARTIITEDWAKFVRERFEYDNRDGSATLGPFRGGGNVGGGGGAGGGGGVVNFGNNYEQVLNNWLAMPPPQNAGGLNDDYANPVVHLNNDEDFVFVDNGGAQHYFDNAEDARAAHVEEYRNDNPPREYPPAFQFTAANLPMGDGGTDIHPPVGMYHGYTVSNTGHVHMSVAEARQWAADEWINNQRIFTRFGTVYLQPANIGAGGGGGGGAIGAGAGAVADGGGNVNMGERLTEGFYEKLYTGFYWKFGVVGGFPASGVHLGATLDGDIRQSIPTIERLPVVEVWPDFLGYHAPLLE